MKLFLIDLQEQFIASSLELICVAEVCLASLFVKCVHKLKSRWFKSGEHESQKSLNQKLMLAPTSPAQSLPCVPAVRSVGRRNLIS